MAIYCLSQVTKGTRLLLPCSAEVLGEEVLPQVTGRAAKQLQLGAEGARTFLPKMLKLDSGHIESRAAGIASAGGESWWQQRDLASAMPSLDQKI